MSPEKGHEDDERAQAERLGTIQLREEKALGRPYSSFPEYKGAQERNFLQRHAIIGQGGMTLT